MEAEKEDERCICACCGRPIDPVDDSESTYCGSIHYDCVWEHACQCNICAGEFLS